MFYCTSSVLLYFCADDFCKHLCATRRRRQAKLKVHSPFFSVTGGGSGKVHRKHIKIVIPLVNFLTLARNVREIIQTDDPDARARLEQENENIINGAMVEEQPEETASETSEEKPADADCESCHSELGSESNPQQEQQEGHAESDGSHPESDGQEFKANSTEEPRLTVEDVPADEPMHDAGYISETAGSYEDIKREEYSRLAADNYLPTHAPQFLRALYSCVLGVL